METTRIALIGIIVEKMKAAEPLNDLLHEYGKHIVGRMGIPYRDKGICIISIIVDAPEQTVAALSGKIGRIPGISVRTMYAKAGGSA